MTDGGPGPSRPDGSTHPLGPILVALTLTGLGGLLITQALAIRPGAGFSVIRPAAMPLAVSIGITLLGVLYLIRTTVASDAASSERVRDEERATHWPTVGVLAALLVAYAFALNGFRVGSIAVPGLGYILATSLFLPAAARTMGSARLGRDALVSVALAVTVYIGFTQFLGVRLPPGLLDFVL